MSCLTLNCSTQSPNLILETNEDLKLLSGLLSDSPEAWRELNQRYGRQIHNAIARVTNRFRSVLSTDDGGEIYAIFCMQLLANDKRKLRTFDVSRGMSLGGWLGMLATHAAYDLLRSRRHSPKSDSGAVLESFACNNPDPYACCAAREQAHQVAHLMAEMSERDREFVRLYFAEGLEPEVVAERMGISLNTVYSKKHKLRARLVALLAAQNIAA
ncbi:MAG TPA: sigma-70 family RNA polymerase sigma factor [Polyangiaceae bacterium]|nr:sigma-70 family RNA polymerase sigma factor [Polyangiaceae bacterium]